jgi:TolB-like protein/Tfp pilus assembly protein PilF
MAYDFGPFRMDVNMRSLEKAGRPFPLRARLFDILELLVRRHGTLVTKEELIKHIWPNQFVEDNNLTVNMSALRKALGEAGSVHKYIETIPGRGYRFKARVSEAKDLRVGFLGKGGRNAGEAIRSLAVLPLLNVSGDAEIDYLSEGITENIINSLSGIPQLRVMARSTVFRYREGGLDPREIGTKLNVDGVLVGRLQQEGDTLWIGIELVDIQDGSQIWGKKYERKLREAFAVQDDIAREISETLFIKLTQRQYDQITRRHTDDWEAYQLYLKGRYFWGRREIQQIRKAMRYFEAAIALDNNFASAYVGLADCYTSLGLWHESTPKEAFPRAKQTLLKALEIDDRLAEAHATLAVINEFFDWDFAAAEGEYKYAINLNPNSALTHHRYAVYLSRAGRFDEAMKSIRLAQRIDPLSGLVNHKIGLILHYGREFESAVEHCRETLELDPLFGGSHIVISLSLLKMGQLEEALAEARIANDLMGNDLESLANLGHTLAAAGRLKEAKEILSELLEISGCKYLPPFIPAIIYAGLEDKDPAFQWLEQAYHEHSYYLTALKTIPLFDSLSHDPRFADLLRRIGL